MIAARLLVIGVIGVVGCGDEGPWEDRVYVFPQFSDDETMIGVNIRRSRERQVTGPWESSTEWCCHEYEVRVLSPDGTTSEVLVAPRPEKMSLQYLSTRHGYALVLDQETFKQLWLTDRSFDQWFPVGTQNVVPSPSGNMMAVLVEEDPTCMEYCSKSVHFYDAVTHELIAAFSRPDWPAERRLRWLDDATVLFDTFLIRIDGTATALAERPHCGGAPFTTSSEISMDGRLVEGRLDGDDVVLDFSEPGSFTPWPGSCASLLDP